MRETYYIHYVAGSEYYNDSYYTIAYEWSLNDLVDAIELIEAQEKAKQEYEKIEQLKQQSINIAKGMTRQ